MARSLHCFSPHLSLHLASALSFPLQTPPNYSSIMIPLFPKIIEYQLIVRWGGQNIKLRGNLPLPHIDKQRQSAIGDVTLTHPIPAHIISSHFMLLSSRPTSPPNQGIITMFPDKDDRPSHT
ncbi:hypothetical protein BGZ57DRAFT_348607 [Hyaloscypha finlandica]|nr:hypothetical protein BGZ57DRAFT_348607 [Hyaloscypha finlandica]